MRYPAMLIVRFHANWFIKKNNLIFVLSSTKENKKQKKRKKTKKEISVKKQAKNRQLFFLHIYSGLLAPVSFVLHGKSGSDNTTRKS